MMTAKIARNSSTKMHASSSTGREPVDQQAKPTVACQKCRDQKLKCDRKLPTCERCHKQKAVCTYPPPPDRKRIAQRTARAKTARLGSKKEQVPPPKASWVAPNLRPTKRQRTVGDPQCDELEASGAEMTESDELPPTEMGLLLLEVYFKYIYNASLLFYKPVCFQLYMQDGIPRYLLRAIFAQAAVYLRPVEPSCQKYGKINPIQRVFEKHRAWARSSSIEALSHADEPSLIRVQALQVLQLYYASQDELQRADVHASLAYRLSQLLGYDLLGETVGSQIGRNMQHFNREIMRRAFWASWCGLVLMGSNRLEHARMMDTPDTLPLPARFTNGGSLQGVSFTLGATLDRSISEDAELGKTNKSSLMADLVMLLRVWSKFETSVLYSSLRSTEEHVMEIETVLNTVSYLEPVPLTDAIREAGGYNESPELVASVYSLPRLIRLLAHAALVPALSARNLQPPISQKAVQEHAGLALEAALEYVKILEQILDHELDIARLWPFCGYGAFIAADVFVVYKSMPQSVWSSETSTKIPGLYSKEFRIIRVVLQVLSNYHKPLRKLADYLGRAMDAGELGLFDLHGNPRAENEQPPNTSTTNQQQLSARYTGLLSNSSSLWTFAQAEILTQRYDAEILKVGDRQALPGHDSRNSMLGGIFQAGWWNLAP